jgi:hypothetical protein
MGVGWRKERELSGGKEDLGCRGEKFPECQDRELRLPRDSRADFRLLTISMPSMKRSTPHMEVDLCYLLLGCLYTQFYLFTRSFIVFY